MGEEERATKALFLCLKFGADADLAVVELGAPIRIRPPQPTIKPANELVFLCLKFIAGETFPDTCHLPRYHGLPWF